MINANFGQTISVDSVVDGLARIFDAIPAHLQILLRDLEGSAPKIEFNAQEVISARSWLTEQSSDWLFGRIVLAGLNREILIQIPSELVLQLVDLHFGGDGRISNAKRPLTNSERLFAAGLFEKFAFTLEQILVDSGLAEVKFVGFEAHPRHLPRPGKTVQALVQKFDASAENFSTCQIQLVWPVDVLRRLHANTDKDPDSASGAKESNFEHDLRRALLQVHVPVSTIFARPEIAFEDLLNLAPGDIIPIILPKKVPLSISGTIIAFGSVGESHGRAAVRIEHLQKEP